MEKFLLAGLLTGITYASFAAHPLVTDDTGTQDAGNHQLEINTDWIRRSGDPGRIGAVTYTYGMQENLDVLINTRYSLSSPTGVMDSSFGLKWRFLETGSASLALKPELFLPTGNTDKGLGTGRTNTGLTVIGSYDAAPWTLHANLGVSRNRFKRTADQMANRRTLWRASAAAMYAVNDQWELVADVGIARNTDIASSTHPAYFLTGVIYSPDRNVDLDIGTKFGLNDAEADRQIGVGLTWRF